MDVSLVNATLENMELLAGVSIPQQQNQYVNFELSAVGYEIAGNPWAFIILADGCVAGYIGVQEIVGEAYITNVAVSEKFRRRGIAEKLLEEAERGAIKRGCVLITLEVRASNAPAKALYKKRGFKEVGTRKNFYSDPREDAEIMTKFFDR